MKIYIDSTQIEIAEILSDELKKMKHDVLNLTNTNSLFSTIQNSKPHPDLLVLDYLIFNHDIFNFASALESIKCYSPFIFYNEPCITRNSRSSHWAGLIQEKINITEEKTPLAELFNKNKEKYLKIFLHIEKLVESKELSPYIKLMQKPKPFPNEIKKSLFERLKEHDDYKLVYDFKTRTKLAENLFNLLLILQESRATPLNADELAQIYSEKHNFISDNSIKVLISNLRKEIRSDTKCKFFIQKTKKGYILIIKN